MKQIILLLFLLYNCEWIQRNSPILSTGNFYPLFFLRMTMEQTRKMTYGVFASYNTMMTSNWGYSRSLKDVCVTHSSTDRWDCVHHLSLTLT